MKKIFLIVGILGILGVIGFIVYKAIDKEEDKKDSSVTVTVQDLNVGQPDFSMNKKDVNAIPVSRSVTATQPDKGAASGTEPSIVRIPSPAPTIAAQPSIKMFAGVNNVLAEIPSSWQVEERSIGNKNQVYFFQNNTSVGYIESYSNSDDTLEIIEQQLKSSPSVSAIQKSAINGNQAIKYSASGNEMIVFIKQGIVYYVSGTIASKLKI